MAEQKWRVRENYPGDYVIETTDGWSGISVETTNTTEDPRAYADRIATLLNLVDGVPTEHLSLLQTLGVEAAKRHLGWEKNATP